MGVSSGKSVHARHRDGPRGRDDSGQAQADLCRRQGQRLGGCLILLWLLLTGSANADTLRIATWNVELTRDGPGLLLRDILAGDDPQIGSVLRIISHLDADLLLLTNVDFDHGLVALTTLAEALGKDGTNYPHIYASAPNAGMQIGADLDRDGRLGEPEDAQGYGEFSGQGGMALLSKLPIDYAAALDFAPVLWRDQPDATLPVIDDAPYFDAATQAALRLSSVGHWDVPVILPDGTRLHLLAFHASTPAFDGPEARNDLRNRDELLFWSRYLDQLPDARFVLLGDANLDPSDGDGLRDTIRGLLSDPRLQDPRPQSAGGTEAALLQGGVNKSQRGDPALDTADWPDEGRWPGNLRVDYVLPAAGLNVLDAGVFWPASHDPLSELLGEGAARASRHAPVWVDLGW